MEVVYIKKGYLIKIVIALFIGIFVVLIDTIINAKYIVQNEFYIANIDIDRTNPKIELLSVTNTNNDYKNYANKIHTIAVTVQIVDENLKSVFCDKEHIKLKVDDVYISSESLQITKVNGKNEYEIKLKDIKENGRLKVEFVEGVAIDEGGLKSDKVEFDTNIIIDNVPPIGEFVENKVADGKVNGTISLSECIVNIEGWNFSEDKLKLDKEFTNNVSYKLPIKDYAGNEAFVEINITQATFINLIYASHNSEVGWTFGYGNYDVAGSEAIKKNPIYKTEALAFNVSGNVEDDFVQAKTYIYTHWGQGSIGKCLTSGLLYDYGDNPNNGMYKSMSSKDLVNINGKKYFQFGGSGINGMGNTDINGNNPISKEVNFQYRYGICGVALSLKDYSQFSIIYQIYVDKVGWVKPGIDGQMCMYNQQYPMSGFRVALIPKSERQYVLNSWNADVGI